GPIGERVDVVPADLAIAEMRLDGEEMILPGLRPRAVGSEDGGVDGELMCDKGHGVGRRTAEVIGHKAHEAECTELEGIAEAIVRIPRARNTAQIPLG